MYLDLPLIERCREEFLSLSATKIVSLLFTLFATAIKLYNYEYTVYKPHEMPSEMPMSIHHT